MKNVQGAKQEKKNLYLNEKLSVTHIRGLLW